MTIASKLKKYLDEAGVKYDTVAHPRTATANETAEAAHVPGDNIAKSVVIHHDDGYVIAVVPASCRVDLSALQETLDRRIGLASEREISYLFEDCDVGAIPPIGAAYGVTTLLDRSLAGKPEVWFEGGDHKTLIHLSGRDFDGLMKNAKRETISYHA